jgi:hypothetical protein
MVIVVQLIASGLTLSRTRRQTGMVWGARGRFCSEAHGMVPPTARLALTGLAGSVAAML